jgi:hypothetical protein
MSLTVDEVKQRLISLIAEWEKILDDNHKELVERRTNGKYWCTSTDGLIDYNARVYQQKETAKFLLKYLFEKEEEIDD